MSGAERRASRRERWESLFSPWALAASGAAISLAFLFQRSLAVRAAMFLLFYGVVLLSGKKVSLATTIIVSAGIVGANLLAPAGKVIAALGPLKITDVALLEGMSKALVFEGLVLVSKASILPGLKLPGRFGSLVAASFVYYDRIVEYKGGIRAATLIEDVDRLMLSMWEASETEAATQSGGRPSAMRPATVGVLAAAVAASYALLLVR